jgi:hypothetical protein
VVAANSVAAVIDEVGLQPVVWNDLFPAGDILLERIEHLPDEMAGAVLLATPDVDCVRGDARFRAPVANVTFEYGYLVGRLTRRRVAICEFEDVQMPSDLDGITVIEAGRFEHAVHQDLAEPAKQQLRGWLSRLPQLADGVPTTRHLHGYSGTWNTQNRFELWAGNSIAGGDDVYFDGKAFLFLDPAGTHGSGVQVGTVHISLGNYRARYEVLNEVRGLTAVQRASRTGLAAETIMACATTTPCCSPGAPVGCTRRPRSRFGAGGRLVADGGGPTVAGRPRSGATARAAVGCRR